MISNGDIVRPMKNVFRKFVIAIVALLAAFCSLIAMACFSDSTMEIWIGFLVAALSAAIWYWFFHIFYDYRFNNGNK